jgi:hypothetical protein
LSRLSARGAATVRRYDEEGVLIVDRDLRQAACAKYGSDSVATTAAKTHSSPNAY